MICSHPRCGTAIHYAIALGSPEQSLEKVAVRAAEGTNKSAVACFIRLRDLLLWGFGV
jgi:hypothetical protein